MPGFADHDKFTFGPLPGEAPRDDQGAAEVQPPMDQNAGYPPADGAPGLGGYLIRAEADGASVGAACAEKRESDAAAFISHMRNEAAYCVSKSK